MKRTKILYWVFTGLLAALMALSSIPDILKVPSAVEMITNHLGYPPYFVQFIGVAKLLGVIAILLPGFPRIKEWAYAGLAYDMIAATYSTISIGEPASHWAMIPLFIVMLFLSYGFYHKLQKEKGKPVVG